MISIVLTFCMVFMLLPITANAMQIYVELDITGAAELTLEVDCGKYFADENGTNEIKLDDTVKAKLPPKIIEGTKQSLTAGDQKELTFRSNAAFSDFIRVELDGKNLDEGNYTVKEGSTIVTLKAGYVGTLSAGTHTIGIVSTSGTAATTFTVNVKQQPITIHSLRRPEITATSHCGLHFFLSVVVY